MPIPKRQKNETPDQFMSRCMADEVMQEYDSGQRYAICYKQIKKGK